MKNRKKMKLALRAYPAAIVIFVAAFLWLPIPLVLSAMAALALHEAAHIIVMSLCGVQCCVVELTPFGGVADAPDYETLPSLKQILIALSGVAASALSAALCWWLAPTGAFWSAFYQVNLSFALLNLLPIWPLDGARAVKAFCRRLGWEQPAVKGMLWLSNLFAIGLVALGLYGAWLGYVNLSLFFMGPYLAYAAHESAVGSRIRGIDRLSTLKQSVREGKAIPARVYACYGEPDALCLMRLLKRREEEKTSVVHILDERTGISTGILSEMEMAERLLTPQKKD
ncbi:MAG: hypothetical protein PHI98_13685 [Eubacteriales bacterium]|nr:hypothetical protein [Eubacteriales bacterium]